jgi:hypothetical protein
VLERVEQSVPSVEAVLRPNCGRPDIRQGRREHGQSGGEEQDHCAESSSSGLHIDDFIKGKERTKLLIVDYFIVSIERIWIVSCDISA